MLRARRLFCAALLASLLVFTAFAQDAREVDKAHDALIYSLAVSPDGKLLASGSYDKLVKIWELPSLKPLKELKGHTHNVYCVTFNKDGQLASSGQDNLIRIWDVKEGKQLKELKGHTDIVDTIAYSPDGKLLVSGSADKSVRLWNPAEGKEVKKLGDHTKSVFAVAYSPDGKLIASGGSDMIIKVFDAASHKELKQLKGHTEAVTGLVFKSPTEIVSISQDKSVRVWNTAGAAGKEETKKFEPTQDDLYGLALQKDGKTLATSGYGGWVNVWDLSAAAAKPTFSKKLKIFGAYCVAFTPDGKALITGHEKPQKDNVKLLVTPIGK